MCLVDQNDIIVRVTVYVEVIRIDTSKCWLLFRSNSQRLLPRSDELPFDADDVGLSEGSIPGACGKQPHLNSFTKTCLPFCPPAIGVEFLGVDSESGSPTAIGISLGRSFLGF